MNFTHLNQLGFAAALLGVQSIGAVDVDTSSSSRLRGATAAAPDQSRALEQEISGTLLDAVIEFADGSKETTINIEIDGVGIYELKNVKQGWRSDGNGRGKKSGESRIKIPAGLPMDSATIDLMGGEPGDATGATFDHRRDLEAVSRNPEQERNLADLRARQLATTLGDKTLLAVRVVAADASYSNTEAVLSDKWFGTNGDQHNLKSQYAACSDNQLNVITADARSMSNDPSNTSTNISNGVVTVQISNTVTGVADGTIRNAVNTQLTTTFGTASGLADHVALCLPPGTSGSWIAYAYINSWNSVYNNQWCNYLSGQMHEVSLFSGRTFQIVSTAHVCILSLKII